MSRSVHILGRDQDAFGLALMDFHHHGQAMEIIERDDGHIEAMDMAQSLYFAAPDEWPSHEKLAISRAAGRVLDIGCGAGRVATWLQERGLEVVGIDVSPGAVKVARQRGVKKVRLASVSEVGQTWGAFDTAVMMGHNLGLLATPAKGRSILGRLSRSMPSGAQIIASTLDPYLTNNPAHRAYHRRNRERGRWGGQVRMRVRYGPAKTPWFSYMFLSRPEVTRLVGPTPWKVARFYGKGPSYSVVLVKEPDRGL